MRRFSVLQTSRVFIISLSFLSVCLSVCLTAGFELKMFCSHLLSAGIIGMALPNPYLTPQAIVDNDDFSRHVIHEILQWTA